MLIMKRTLSRLKFNSDVLSSEEQAAIKGADGSWTIGPNTCYNEGGQKCYKELYGGGETWHDVAGVIYDSLYDWFNCPIENPPMPEGYEVMKDIMQDAAPTSFEDGPWDELYNMWSHDHC